MLISESVRWKIKTVGLWAVIKYFFKKNKCDCNVCTRKHKKSKKG